MKTRTFVIILILVLAVLIITGSCATGKKAIQATIEPIYGTWANPDYNTAPSIAKVAYRPDGSYGERTHTELEVVYTGTFTIIESWIDSNGNKYYKVDLVWGIQTWYELWRINEIDTVFEIIPSEIDYPIEMDPENPAYKIFYRQ